jgi:hypothetical protein
MTAIEPLARNYRQARADFLAATGLADARVSSYPHPLTGPDGEQLAIDVAELGDLLATTTVLVVSATHGVEGLCGSALQSQWLRATPEVPPGVRVVMVHALNPHGFAWVRRVNEDNVDLNRNFIDWDQPLPHNDDYDAMADALVPARWDDDARAEALTVLMGHLERLGPAGMQSAVSRGQYRHPTGVFYGGQGPAWSNSWLRSWVAANLLGSDKVIVIDVHSGLGPWGHGEHIVHHPSGTEGYQRAEALFGGVRSTVDGESVSALLSGDWLDAFDDMVPDAEVTSVCLEFGTVDTLTVLEALRADAWLHAFGDPTGPQAPAVRAQVRAAFADDDPAWIARLWEQFHNLLDTSLRHARSH